MFQTRKIHPAIGLEIIGIDLSGSSNQATIDAIEALWREHLVLVFPRQSLTEDRQIAFSKHFGELDITIEDDKKSSKNLEVLRIANVDEQGQKLDINHPIQHYFSTLTALWHTDGSYRAVPSFALDAACAGGDAAGRGDVFCQCHRRL